METVRANVVDLVMERIFFGEITFEQGRIVQIDCLGPESSDSSYLLPGFVDAHVHIESALLAPDEFARAAMRRGTLACVSDPHEIANVLGLEGVRYMQRRAELTPFKILFGAPSCVPATSFETAGATLDAGAVHYLLSAGGCTYLSEVMNYPGVLNQDSDVMAKIAAAKQLKRPVDGHAPALRGELVQRYAQAGISTDHECTTLAEALDKLEAGMSILIREGSAARDFERLHPLLDSHPDKVMLCSDDKHPDDLMESHILDLVKRGLALGHSLFSLLRAATLNSVRHYDLSLGLLQVDHPMDALLVDNLRDFNIERAWINGNIVVAKGCCVLKQQAPEVMNRFVAQPVSPEQLQIAHPNCPCRVIEVRDGSLYTPKRIAKLPCKDQWIMADTQQDVLFIAVVNRYQVSPPVMALIHGFGLREGALASSVAHDSHNIVAVGSSAEWLAEAINGVIAHQGGLVAVDSHSTLVLPLPLAGLMSDQSFETTGRAYRQISDKARQMGSPLRSPFMTLSFMSLLVIPELKLSDKGLFDGKRFEFCSLAASAEEIAQADLAISAGALS